MQQVNSPSSARKIRKQDIAEDKSVNKKLQGNKSQIVHSKKGEIEGSIKRCSAINREYPLTVRNIHTSKLNEQTRVFPLVSNTPVILRLLESN